MQTEKAAARRQTRGARKSTAKAADGAKAGETAAPVGLGHLDHVLGYVLRRAQIAVFNDFRRTFAEFDLRPTQYAVLSIISDHPGLKQGDVSAALGIKRTNFVAVLDELERRGLARRQAVPDDRRSRALYLTDVGAALTAQIRGINEANEARLASLLPAGKADVLMELLRNLTDAIGDQKDEG